ncbi:MAG: 4-(cytidine 5'-diphospho)-2-C-methyl-D-erythritol kinase [Solirubrobacterales bacterium]
MTALPLRALAPAKINLGLFVGPLRADGRHELVSVMQSISLADELTLEAAPEGAEQDGDEVVCPGVAAPPEQNLAARALAAFREATGWEAPPLRLMIEKRIPVASGLGGGSADAAATLRLALSASGLGDESLLLSLASELGADVPAQVHPGRWLASGAGEALEALPDPVAPIGVLVLPVAHELSTAAVYAEADRLGALRERVFLRERRRLLHAELDLGMSLPHDLELLHNDLERPARSLCHAIGEALREAREAGAEPALVSGSGPTVVGLFPRANGLAAAKRAVAGLAGCEPAPLAVSTVGADFAQPAGLSVRNN